LAITTGSPYGNPGTRRAHFDAAKVSAILVVRLKSLGDILFTIPALHALREACPLAEIHFLVSKELVPLLEGFAGVHHVIGLDRAGLRSGRPVLTLRALANLSRLLRRPKFSLAVDFQGYGETAFLAWWTRAPERWGTIYRPQRKWAYTRWLARDSSIHPAEAHLQLLRAGGIAVGSVRNEFRVPESARREASSFLAAHHFDSKRPILFIQPFTSSPQKDWPLKSHLQVAHHWRTRGVQVLFGGGPNDSADLEPARAAGFAVSAGVPLLVSAGLMDLSALVLGSDTGMLHLAVALGKRVIMFTPSWCRGTHYPLGHQDWSLSADAGLPLSELSAHRVNQACAEAFQFA
jgi:ADP-heptose:LPS heptosyltransferase